MRARLRQLIAIYEEMLRHTRSKIRRECLENFIGDLKQLLSEVQ